MNSLIDSDLSADPVAFSVKAVDVRLRQGRPLGICAALLHVGGSSLLDSCFDLIDFLEIYWFSNFLPRSLTTSILRLTLEGILPHPKALHYHETLPNPYLLLDVLLRFSSYGFFSQIPLLPPSPTKLVHSFSQLRDSLTPHLRPSPNLRDCRPLLQPPACIHLHPQPSFSSCKQSTHPSTWLMNLGHIITSFCNQIHQGSFVNATNSKGGVYQ